MPATSLAQFTLMIFYGQLVVQTTALPQNGLLWDDDEGAQGFAWAPGIVAFGVSDHNGLCVIRVGVAPRVQVDPTALWAVQVPFEVTAAPLDIGTIGEMPREVTVPAGHYNLVFQALPGAGVPNDDRELDLETTYVLDLTFCPDTAPDFAILKQGTELGTDKVLRRHGELAG